MPEWAVYYLITTVAAGILTQVVAIGLALIAAGRGIRRITRGRDTEVLALGPDPATGFVWHTCHSTRCAHLQTEHDAIGPDRLMCRRCDRVSTTA